MTTKLAVYNLALSHLRETKLAAVDEAREARYALDDWWDQTLAWMLEAGFWKFALRSVRIDTDPDVTEAFGLAYPFSKPTDWVRTYQISASEMMEPPLEDWVEEGGYLWANVDPIYMRYVSNDASYGMSMARWSARFVDALAFRLAYNTCPRITGSSDSLIKALGDYSDSALSKALSFEAMREPNRRPPEGKWNQSRHGSRWTNGNHRYA